MAHVLVVLGHPRKESFNHALAGAYTQALREGGATVQVLSLIDLAFDPILRAGHEGSQPLEADLVAAREAFERADHVAWFFPTWWGHVPALVKGFVDRLFLPGWAFRYGSGPLPEGLLRGRTSRVVTTMDSPRFWYLLFHFAAIHGSFIHATLRFVGFERIRSTVLYKLRGDDDARRRSHLERSARLGAADAKKMGGKHRRVLPHHASPASDLGAR